MNYSTNSIEQTPEQLAQALNRQHMIYLALTKLQGALLPDLVESFQPAVDAQVEVQTNPGAEVINLPKEDPVKPPMPAAQAEPSTSPEGADREARLTNARAATYNAYLKKAA